MANDALAKQFLRDEDSVSSLDITKTVLLLSAPAVFQMLLQMLVGLVDTAMVGRLPEGGAAVAAVSLAHNIFLFALTIFAAVGTGSTALVARSIGAGDNKAANRVLVQSLVSGGALALLVMFAGSVFAQQALDFVGAEAKANEYGVTYLRIVSLAAIPTLSIQVLCGSLRGAGDTSTPMYISGGTNVLNAILNYILIYGHFGFPEMGVAGAAIASALSRTIGALILFGLLASRRLKLSFSGVKSVAPDFLLIRRIMNVGIPAAIETGLNRGAQLALTKLVATLGTTAVAAHQIAVHSESISFMPGWGISIAGAAMVAQSLGAHKYKLAERFGYRSLKITIAVMSVLGVFFLAVPGFFTRLFIQDAEVVGLSATCLRLVAVSQPASAATMVMSNILRTAGDTRRMLLVSLAGFWLVRLPIGYLLVAYTGLGLAGVWVGMIVDLFLRGAVTILYFRRGNWKDIKV